MSARIPTTAAAALLLILLFGASVCAQSVERIGESLGGANTSLLARALAGRGGRTGVGADTSAVTFKPAGDSGVTRSLADAFAGSANEKAVLAELFTGILQGYNAEVAKEGKSNNLAAALTFFISTNVMAYAGTDEPSDAATESLFKELQTALAGLPEFARLSDAEKQRMHDWLVCMGGFSLGYLEARKTGDRQGLETYRQLAAYSLRLVLGIDPARLSFRNDRLVVGSDEAAAAASPQPARTPAASAPGVVGVWSKSASSPWSTSPGAVATNAGYYKGQYQFRPDGTYSFKGESWGGYLRSEEFWTIEESGSYAVEGDALTVTPRASRSTLRDSSGTVRKTQNNALEATTYSWRLHYFEGIGETNLVLRPARPTTRDGAFSANSDFPDSYLYSQNGKLEWRF